MKNISLILTYLLLSALLYGKSFHFANDGLSWGFIPEWDDWETNSFELDYEHFGWYGNLTYKILTDREITEIDSSRLDSLKISADYSEKVFSSNLFNLIASGGVAVELSGDFYGYEIQGGWHENAAVRRSIPLVYDDSVQQISVPLELELSFPLAIAPYMAIGQTFSYPFWNKGYFGVGIRAPRHILPLDLQLRYSYLSGESGNKTYDVAESVKQGFSLKSQIDFWPFSIRKTAFFNGNWGLVLLGFSLVVPKLLLRKRL